MDVIGPGWQSNISEETFLDTSSALNLFLASVEKRAFRMAQIATNHSDEALDIVQDAMMTLAKRYADRDESEWGPLFHRIMQNRIRDWYRRQKVRNRIFSWFSQNDDEEEVVDTLPDERSQGPNEQLQNEELGTALQQALTELPLRQQQTFLLRSWEGLSVEETATAMGISGGSVKTHYSRAVQALREKLAEFDFRE